jgi:poly(A) polymerase
VNELVNELGARVARASREAYFVGGCVRDALRGEPVKDVDIALAGDTHAVGRALAREFRGHVFWLREEEEVVRVLLPEHDRLQIDLTPLKSGVEADLRARDLTINAMAVPAGAGLDPAAVLDPTGGRRDLAERRIRFVSPEAPERDPLRTLRALRFRWKLGFALAEGTTELIRRCVPMLERVSGERIRDELFQLLALPDPADALAECLEFGLLPWLTGHVAPASLPAAVTGPPASLPAVAEVPANVRRLVGLLRESTPELAGLMETEPTPPRRRREVLLWAAGLQPLSPPLEPEAAARRLALSSEERQLIARGIAGAVRVREIVSEWPQPGRVRYRLLEKEAKPAGPEAVLLAAEEAWTPAHAELLDEALRRLLRPEPPLLTGTEVMELAGLRPGPAVGEVLREVEEARADGLLRTREDAARFLRERFRKPA